MDPLAQVRALIDMTEDDNSEFTNSMIEDILHNLGARIDTRYNANITHLIWQDGKNEKNLKKCLTSSNIHVVSPLWVVECQQANEKVEENAWPAEVVDRNVIDTSPSPIKKGPVASTPNETGAHQTPFAERKNAKSGETSNPKATPGNKRKATGAKSKSPRKRTILLSGDDDDDDHELPTDAEDDVVSAELITPKRKSLGAKRPQSTSKTPSKAIDKRKQKDVGSDSNDNDENAPPSKSANTPKSRTKGSDGNDQLNVKPKKTPGSAKKSKPSSLCLSQLSDFVRDAAYDLAKNHPEFVIFESSDANYVVVEKPVRTIKVFYALAKGSWIISAEWILASVAAGKWLNPEDFEFKDLPSKKSREARSDPNFRGIFEGEHVYVRKGVEPGQAILQELFLTCGAQIVSDEESASVVIAAPEESGGISSKWLLDSLIVFEKLDSEGYLTTPISPDI